MKTSRNFKRLCFCLVTICLVICAAGCKKCKKCSGDNPVDEKTYYDNEKDKLVFSTQELDKVFNPFFSTSATDSNVVGFTQIGMVGNDKDGKPVWGDSEAVIAKDVQIVTVGTKDIDQTTTYYFVLKNNVKFSNGSALTIKDVLFNLYVYLDPVYTGSSTIYSTDIVGLKEYRTQEESETEQNNFKLKFQTIADSRLDALKDACVEVLDLHDDIANEEQFKEYLKEYINSVENKQIYEKVLDDYNKVTVLFKEELESDYSNSIDSYEDMIFTDEDGETHKGLFTTDVEVFLYNEGYITWNKKDKKLMSSFVNDPADLKNWTKEQAIAKIIEDKLPDSIEEIITYWNTAYKMNDFLVNEAMEEYYRNTTLKFPNIEGIKFANHTQPVTVNGVTYGVPEYNEDGSVKDGQNEVLSIQIHNVDPKAIWNFSFAVAPMYYYSDQEHIDKFDYVSNFGVERGSQTFMTEVVGNPTKNALPVGAGPYAASKDGGGITNIDGSDFYKLGVVYFERNPYYVMGQPKIKSIRLRVTPANQMLNSLYKGEVDFVEPNAKPETIKELNDKKNLGIGNESVQTSGYGYIGINAGKVPDIAVRQAIMHTINTQLCVDYYKTTAKPIYRSMSLSSWAYPDNCTPYYPYIGGAVPEDLTVVNPDYAQYVTKLNKKAGEKLSDSEQREFLRYLVEDKAGYSLNGNGVYQKGNNILKYTFTIAGQETDHPAWQAMFNSGEILNKVGFQINVTTDSNALKKLSQGALTVWAAAWGSTIDPDMYQVYHKDSNATSVLNWGYKQILQNTDKYSYENALINDLSEIIDLARQTTVQSERESLYSDALDIVMQLAIELPTYQRDDLFAFNTNRLDVTSLTPKGELSSYKGLTSDIHKISFVER